MQSECSHINDLPSDTPPLQVLVVLEARLEREVIAAAITSLRPSWTVIPLTPAELESRLARCEADFVLCTTVTPVIDTVAPSWIVLRSEGKQPSRISIRGEEREREGLTLDELVELVESMRD